MICVLLDLGPLLLSKSGSGALSGIPEPVSSSYPTLTPSALSILSAQDRTAGYTQWAACSTVGSKDRWARLRGSRFMFKGAAICTVAAGMMEKGRRESLWRGKYRVDTMNMLSSLCPQCIRTPWRKAWQLTRPTHLAAHRENRCI